MNRNCDECKFENTPAKSQPCCSCMDFEHTQWQPKEEAPKPITYTREEVEEIITLHEHNKMIGLESNEIDDFNELKTKDMNNPTYGKNTIYKQEDMKGEELKALQITIEKQKSKEPTQLSTSSIHVLAEVKKERTILDDLEDKIKELEKEIKELEAQNEKLNKLVEEIEKALSREFLTPSRFYNVAYDLIKDYRTPSIIGTIQTIEINGKKYEVTIKKEILNS